MRQTRSRLINAMQLMYLNYLGHTRRLLGVFGARCVGRCTGRRAGRCTCGSVHRRTLRWAAGATANHHLSAVIT